MPIPCSTAHGSGQCGSTSLHEEQLVEGVSMFLNLQVLPPKSGLGCNRRTGFQENPGDEDKGKGFQKREQQNLLSSSQSEVFKYEGSTDLFS